MKPTDQIYPFFDFNVSGYGDAIGIEDVNGRRQLFPFNRGMDLRTYLAGQAMQGLLSNDRHELSTPTYLAEVSVKYADALIVELNK